MISRHTRLLLVGGVALFVGGCPSPPPPLPGGPAPEYEPPRAFELPKETAPAAEAPGPVPPPEAAAPAATASASPTSGGTPAASEWTSSGVEAPPPPKGSGDPIPADGRVGAKHFVVMYKGSRRATETTTRTKPEAKKHAESCLAKAKAKGAQFEAVVKDCTDEPFGKERGGDLATFRPELMDPPFTKALLDLKVGQVSGVVETPLGFHVILRTQ